MKALLISALLAVGLSACSPWLWASNVVTSAARLVGAASNSDSGSDAAEPQPQDVATNCDDVTVVTSTSGEIIAAFPPGPACD